MYAIERDVVGVLGKAGRIAVTVATRPSVVQACQKQTNGALIVNSKRDPSPAAIRGITHRKATPTRQRNGCRPTWRPRARDSRIGRAAGRERSLGPSRDGWPPATPR